MNKCYAFVETLWELCICNRKNIIIFSFINLIPFKDSHFSGIYCSTCLIHNKCTNKQKIYRLIFLSFFCLNFSKKTPHICEMCEKCCILRATFYVPSVCSVCTSRIARVSVWFQQTFEKKINHSQAVIKINAMTKTSGQLAIALTLFPPTWRSSSSRPYGMAGGAHERMDEQP